MSVRRDGRRLQYVLDVAFQLLDLLFVGIFFGHQIILQVLDDQLLSFIFGVHLLFVVGEVLHIQLQLLNLLVS